MTEYEAIFGEDEIMLDVRRRKANVIEKRGGWEGYLKHQDEEKPRLEAEGWHFVSPEEAARAKVPPA